MSTEVETECEGNGWRHGMCHSSADHALCKRHLEQRLEEAAEKAVNEATINLYLIWSFENDAWWKADERGYTTDRQGAGIYSFERALEIVLSANINFNYASGEPIKMPNEAMVPLSV